jgi:5-(carboxyamino)imidazole ribonucleotide mutase
MSGPPARVAPGPGLCRGGFRVQGPVGLLIERMKMKPLVSILMGSRSDWETMQNAAQMLEQLGVPHEARVLSAHRTPDALEQYVAEAEDRGVEVFIAGAGGAAHLAGVVAARTLRPVLGVPIQTKSLGGLDSLLSMVQMPAGIPVGTLAIGSPGASNAALLAVAILAVTRPELRERLENYRREQVQAVLARSDPRLPT